MLLRLYLSQNRGVIVDAVAIVCLAVLAYLDIERKVAVSSIVAIVFARIPAKSLRRPDEETPPEPDDTVKLPRPPASSRGTPNDGDISGLATPFIVGAQWVKKLLEQLRRPPGGGGTIRPRAPMPSSAG
jgi:hypothetical protein